MTSRYAASELACFGCRGSALDRAARIQPLQGGVLVGGGFAFQVHDVDHIDTLGQHRGDDRIPGSKEVGAGEAATGPYPAISMTSPNGRT
jgi:hypothetical protein